MSEGPGRFVAVRLASPAGGGLIQAAVDSSGRAWVRVSMTGEWTSWTPVASRVTDIDVAAGHGDADQIGLVAVTTGGSGDPQIHSVTAAGVVTGTPL